MINLFRIFVFLSLLVPALAVAMDTTATFEDAFSPHQGATELVVKAIVEAKKSVHVAAYSFTSRPIASALAAAHDKGIDVEMVLDKSQRNGWIVQYLKDHKIPARINDNYAIMHDCTSSDNCGHSM